MHLEPSSKFAAVFLSRCDVDSRLPEEEELRPGVWVSRGLGIEIGDHWRTWLGSIAADEVRQAGLGIYVTATSTTSEVVDGENAALTQRVNDLFNGLLLQGVPRFERGCVVHGAYHGGAVQVRGYSAVDEHYRTAGMDFTVGMAEVQRALTISDQLRHIQNAQPDNWARLLRGIRTLLLANRQSNTVGDRLHQLVRSTESVIKPRTGTSRNDFAHRGQTIALNNQGARNALLQLYDLRSAVEHLHMPTDVLPAGRTREENRRLVDRCTVQADSLARHALLSILESPALMGTFQSDDQIDAFWKQEFDDRVRLWGRRLDILQ
jgi:hypothetical protein